MTAYQACFGQPLPTSGPEYVLALEWYHLKVGESEVTAAQAIKDLNLDCSDGNVLLKIWNRLAEVRRGDRDARVLAFDPSRRRPRREEAQRVSSRGGLTAEAQRRNAEADRKHRNARVLSLLKRSQI